MLILMVIIIFTIYTIFDFIFFPQHRSWVSLTVRANVLSLIAGFALCGPPISSGGYCCCYCCCRTPPNNRFSIAELSWRRFSLHNDNYKVFHVFVRNSHISMFFFLIFLLRKGACGKE